MLLCTNKDNLSDYPIHLVAIAYLRALKLIKPYLNLPELIFI